MVVAILAHAQQPFEKMCSTGLTLRGAGLDGDWMVLQALGHEYDNKDGRSIQFDCGMYGCADDAKKALVNNSWNVLDNRFAGSVLAICTHGCPDVSYWPKDWNYSTVWKVINTSQVVTAETRCCLRKPQECDQCDRNQCARHGMLGCLFAQSGCCKYQLMDGGCHCKGKITECDHSDSESTIV